MKTSITLNVGSERAGYLTWDLPPDIIDDDRDHSVANIGGIVTAASMNTTLRVLRSEPGPERAKLTKLLARRMKEVEEELKALRGV